MNVEATPQIPNPSDWVYLRLYLGAAMDRMDWLLIEIQKLVNANPRIGRWFYIRYVDDGGIHIRLRAQALPEDAARLSIELNDGVAMILARISSQPPGNYAPMVAAPGYTEQIETLSIAHNDIRLKLTTYEPEYDKFGGPVGMPIAEELFHVSSEIACDLLQAEAVGQLSRKSVLPALMRACFDAFQPQTDPVVFWREYAYYWLGSKTPAAEDWRDRFRRKAEELDASGISTFDPDPRIRALTQPLIARWTEALGQAASAYAAAGTTTDADAEVLTFNIAHLMNNRLGIAVLEEAYIASLLEGAIAREALAA
ncbi:thiopeptide-type bacteriocin biosynthesis protein [Paracoccus aminophilus]|uniref:Thiopeptide-type bacteriocin biosynthesis domain-containing protein n=1 Tax=Paracoccus aminophilus JCM 7686 TaxID=1367847 RepID=S5XTU6_PARAH|nr:thiopeptide-type bacteriocin biosynthesis protein [Paracoccus aminophilus]AGT10939.1 hypothetical protein JCM7686_pAMI4p249 [Paracoccus aminophilus JCM 7686]